MTELKMLKAKMEKMIDSMNDLFQTANCTELSQYKHQLYNIGITINNKLVEIIQLYRRKKLTIEGSPLFFNLIVPYFISIFEEAIRLFQEYINMTVEANTYYINYEKKDFCLKRARASLDAYRRLDDKVFDFSLSQDIDEALNVVAKEHQAIGLKGGYDLYKDITNKQNQELKSLGIDKTLINPNLNIEEFAKINLEQIKFELKDKPLIVTCLELLLSNYVTLANNGDGDAYTSIINFDYRKEIVNAILEFLSFDNSHGRDEWLEIKRELRSLEMEDLIPFIESELYSPTQIHVRVSPNNK